MDIYVLAALAALCTVGGYFIPWNLPRAVKLVILVPLFGAYAAHAYGDMRELPILGTFILVGLGVFAAWRVLPYSFCCGHHVGHGDRTNHVLSALAIIPFLLHALFDTELIREASWWMIPLLVAHKATDGTALRVTTKAVGSAWLRRAFLVVGVLATPLGLLVPEAFAESMPHEIVVAFVVGFYLFLAYALVREMPSKEEAGLA